MCVFSQELHVDSAMPLYFPWVWNWMCPCDSFWAMKCEQGRIGSLLGWHFEKAACASPLCSMLRMEESGASCLPSNNMWQNQKASLCCVKSSHKKCMDWEIKFCTKKAAIKSIWIGRLNFVHYNFYKYFIFPSPNFQSWLFSCCSLSDSQSLKWAWRCQITWTKFH